MLTNLFVSKNLRGGHRPILISSVWIKLTSRLLLKEAGAPLKDLVQDAQFGVGVPHGGLALLPRLDPTFTKAPRMLRRNLIFRMHLAQCIQRSALTNWKSTSMRKSHGFLPQKTYGAEVSPFLTLRKRISLRLQKGVPQGDPLSTLVFATAMSLLLKDIIQSKGPDVSMVADVDGTVLLGTAGNVTQAITEIQAETTTVVSNY